jgi:hypothetical protein
MGCRYGGERPWFRCPKCNRRCAILFFVRTAVACRTCEGVAYRSQLASRSHRLFEKRDRLLGRLGVAPGPVARVVWKPKWMHQRTFDKLRLRAANAELAALMAAAGELGLRLPCDGGR